MHHKPSGFLSNPQITRHFVAADSILAVSQHPSCGEPLIQSDCGILKDSPNLDGELALCVMAPALPETTLRKKLNTIRATRRARNAFGPASDCQIVNVVIGIREIDDCFLKALWFGLHNVLHAKNHSLNRWMSQVNYYPDEYLSSNC